MGKFTVESGVLPIAAKTLLIEMDCAAYRALLAKTLKLGKFAFLDAWTENDSTYVKLVTTPELGNWVPKAVRKLVESRGIEFVDIREYNPRLLKAPPYKIPVDCIPSFFQDRVEVHAVMSIVEMDQHHCKQVLEGSISVRVLGMGRILESIIQESLRQTYDVMPQVVERWVKVREELLSQPGGHLSLVEGRPEELQSWLSHDDELKKVLQSPYQQPDGNQWGVVSPRSAAVMPVVHEDGHEPAMVHAAAPQLHLPQFNRSGQQHHRSSTVGSLQELFSPTAVGSPNADSLLSEYASDDYNSCDEGDIASMASGFATPGPGYRSPGLMSPNGFMSPNGYLSPDAVSMHDMDLMSPQEFDDAMSDAVLDLASPTAADAANNVLTSRGGHFLAARQCSDHLQPEEHSPVSAGHERKGSSGGKDRLLQPSTWQRFNDDFQQWTQVWDQLDVAEVTMPSVQLPIRRRPSRGRSRSQAQAFRSTGIPRSAFQTLARNSLASSLCALCCVGSADDWEDEPLPSPWVGQELTAMSGDVYQPPLQPALEKQLDLHCRTSATPPAETTAVVAETVSQFVGQNRGGARAEETEHLPGMAETSRGSDLAVVQVEYSNEDLGEMSATRTGSSSALSAFASLGAVVSAFFPSREASSTSLTAAAPTATTPATAAPTWQQQYAEVLDHIEHMDDASSSNMHDSDSAFQTQSLLLSPVSRPTARVTVTNGGRRGSSGGGGGGPKAAAAEAGYTEMGSEDGVQLSGVFSARGRVSSGKSIIIAGDASGFDDAEGEGLVEVDMDGKGVGQFAGRESELRSQGSFFSGWLPRLTSWRRNDSANEAVRQEREGVLASIS